MDSYIKHVPNVADEAFKKVQPRFENIERSRAFPAICAEVGFERKKVLDVGCSYGEFLVHAGPGSLGVTVSAQEASLARWLGLDVILGSIHDSQVIEQVRAKGPFELVWANNIFEHLEEPHIFLRSLTIFSDERTRLVLGVPVFPKVPFFRRILKLRGSLASNHINFFTRETLIETVRRAGWEIIAARPFITRYRWLDLLVSFLAPHQYIVARKIPDFVYPRKRLDEVGDRLDRFYF